MNPTSWEIIVGDAAEQLRALPAESVHSCVTSPPYWGLRDYETAEWEGGDAGCDHLQRTGGIENNGLGDASWGNAMTAEAVKNATERRMVPYRAVCAKCGAKRIDSQLGLESTPEEYVAKLVDVFREVWRVLRQDGTLWLNLGDSYARSAGDRKGNFSRAAKGLKMPPASDSRKVAPGLKAKDLVGIPWLVAFALRADGWYLRRDVIWSKPNPMPESVEDRPTTSHEYLFLFTKSGDPVFWSHREGGSTRKRPKPDYRWVDRRDGDEVDAPPPNWESATFVDEDGEEKRRWVRINLWRGRDYYYDADAIREVMVSSPSDIRKMVEENDRIGGKHKDLDDKLVRASSATNIGRKRSVGDPTIGRNKRSVWEIATQPYPGAHFATFPTKLAEPCILAGTPSRTCGVCSAPWRRVVRVERNPSGINGRQGIAYSKGTPETTVGAGEKISGRAVVRQAVELGWEPTCEHEDDSGSAVVLDPFSGAATTGLVATQHRRSYIGLELNPKYADMGSDRIRRWQANPSGHLKGDPAPIVGQIGLELG